jgi:hypothetical protein
MAGHNRTTCSALQDAILDVVAKRKALAIAEEKKALLLSRLEKAENAAKKKKAKPNSTSSSAQPVTGGESCMGSDSEPESSGNLPWEMIADPRELNPPTTCGLHTEF